MPGIASAATSVVIGHLAGGTSTIRVGAGGIMLPNHAPLVIAEQFGTLEALYPGRIDLGLGRAPGSDRHHAAGAAPRSDGRADASRRTCRSCRRSSRRRSRASASARCRAPARRCRSGSSARARSARSWRRSSACRSRSPRTSRPTTCSPALEIYRETFKPSAQLDAPYAMAGPQRRRGGHRRGGAAAVHVAAAGVRRDPARPARAVPAAGGADRRPAGAVGARAGVAHARATPSSARRRRCAPGCRRSST